MASSALGWAYLAGLEATGRSRTDAMLRKALGTAWPEAEKGIAGARKHYAEHGYVLNLRHYHPDVNAIGVPVVSSSRRVVMALNSGGAVSVATVEKLRGPIADALKDLASRLSGMLPQD
jgi:DNA-binding IclR family transcriptional regulator